MPTDKNTKPKKTTEKEIPKKVSAFGQTKPNTFLLQISKCGTNSLSKAYPQIENVNPVILGLNGVKTMSDGFVPKKNQPFYQYLLACAILNGLTYKEENLADDIKNIADRIKNLSLESLKGGTDNERP